jgi:Tol biopolymer transport system component
MRITGADRDVLVKNGTLMNPSHPSYSPDGSRIVFQATVSAGSGALTNVYTVDANSGNDLEKVNKGDAEAREPAYSPDGRSIVFRRGGNLFTMATDGSGVDQLTTIDSQDGANTAPSWGR